MEQRLRWPEQGRHILAQYDAETIVVYQAYNAAIADWAVEHQQLGGRWSFERMSWIKTNFLWMMYRSGWAVKKNQNRILAIRLSREGFEEILAQAVETVYRAAVHGPERSVWQREGKRSGVRLQWDPDHSPTGHKEERRAVQLGMRNEALRRFALEWTLSITDITEEVVAQRTHARPNRYDRLMTPCEAVYLPADPALCARLRIDGAGSPLAAEVQT